MSKLSKEQIKTLSSKHYLYSFLRLKCDGREITLFEKLFQRKLRVVLYVDGSLKGGWIVDPKLHPESKFYLPVVVYRKKSLRSKKKERIEFDMRQPDFASIGQALRHLNKVCDSVEVIEESDQ